MSDDDSLNDSAENLTKELKRLNDESKDNYTGISNVARFNRHVLIAVVIGLVLDLLLTVGLTFAFTVLNRSEQQIGTLADRVDFSQTVTRRQVLCPLYTTFLKLKNPASAARFPGGPTAYDQLYVQLQLSYDALKCNGDN